AGRQVNWHRSKLREPSIDVRSLLGREVGHVARPAEPHTPRLLVGAAQSGGQPAATWLDRDLASLRPDRHGQAVRDEQEPRHRLTKLPPNALGSPSVLESVTPTRQRTRTRCRLSGGTSVREPARAAVARARAFAGPSLRSTGNASDAVWGSP